MRSCSYQNSYETIKVTSRLFIVYLIHFKVYLIALLNLISTTGSTTNNSRKNITANDQ